jgi:5-methylthioribose kinase
MTQQYMNPEMCELTEKVIFCEPYTVAPLNRHTSPQLDGDVEALRVGAVGNWNPWGRYGWVM